MTIFLLDPILRHIFKTSHVFLNFPFRPFFYEKAVSNQKETVSQYTKQVSHF